MGFPRIRDLREDSDLNQAQMAQKLNVSARTYAHYELGDRNIPIPILIDLAKIHKTSVDYLLGLTNER